jgi:hypothetical protein
MATVTTPGAVSGGTLGITDKKTLDGSALSYVVWQIPPRIGSVTVQVYVVSAGSYRVEMTASPIDDITTDTADWFDMFGADQSASRQQAIFASVTAVRVTRVSGIHRACIRGQ